MLCPMLMAIIWDITIDLANGSYEFKFSADKWGIQEIYFQVLGVR